ncbi:MAG: hypothetical protein NT166_29645 [Candidatus Aminicenantes bacterium]|nr:hypothetical protein [Candidatus Aminicenantes bacterium]
MSPNPHPGHPIIQPILVQKLSSFLHHSSFIIHHSIDFPSLFSWGFL